MSVSQIAQGVWNFVCETCENMLKNAKIWQFEEDDGIDRHIPGSNPHDFEIDWVSSGDVTPIYF